jgi:hypothetical protein
MMFYRVAIQVDTSTRWRWSSTVLSSLDTVFRYLRLYYAPLEHLLVFSSGSCEELDEQLAQENSGLGSNSVTAAQFLRERLIHVPETKSDVPVHEIRTHRETAAIGIAAKGWLNKYSAEALVSDEMYMGVLDSKRVEVECGTGSDHDLPYTFALPGSRPLVLAWVKILAKLQRGELHP